MTLSQLVRLFQPFNRPPPPHPLAVDPIWRSAYEARQAQVSRHGRSSPHLKALQARVHGALERGRG
jgi:hypothetical protein